MSTLDFALELTVPQNDDLPTLQKAESAYVDSTYMERALIPALQAADQGMKEALRLEKLINQRGRNSENASLCRNLVNDCFMGFDDLRQALREAKAGNQAAVNKIPGILTAIQESLNPESLLSKMKAYSNKGEKALPNYVYETLSSLGKVFDRTCLDVMGISDVLDVRIRVQQSVKRALGNYKFHGVQQAVVAAPVIEQADFDETETAWFDSPTVKASEPARTSQTVMSKIRKVLGGLMPRVALLGTLFAAGCGPDANVSPEDAPLPIINIPTVAAPAPVAPVPVSVPSPEPASRFEVKSAKTLWHAISAELTEECGLSGNALQRETGKLVKSSFDAKNSGYLEMVKGMETAANADTRLAQVSDDLAQYGVIVGDTFNEIKGNVRQTGQVGAYNMDSSLITSYGNAAFDGYSCPN